MRALTKPQVFIIESLEIKDEKADLREGAFLQRILYLNDKNSKYYYIRTKKELIEILKEFRHSNYRYLHLSCHGDRQSIALTYDRIYFSELAKIICPYLKERRLFISSCKIVNNYLAKKIMPTSGCYSIIGPSQEINFNVASIMWASFYHLIFNLESRRITNDTIKPTLQRIVNCFDEPLTYYRRNSNLWKGYSKRVIKPTKQ